MFEESHWEHNSMIIPMRLVKLCNKGIFKSSDVIRKAIKYLVSLQLNQVRFDLHKHIQHNTSTKKNGSIAFSRYPKSISLFYLAGWLNYLIMYLQLSLVYMYSKKYMCTHAITRGKSIYAMPCRGSFSQKKARAWCNVIYSLVSKV